MNLINSFNNNRPFSPFPFLNAPEQPIPSLEANVPVCVMTQISAQSFDEKFAKCPIEVDQDSSVRLQGNEIERLMTVGVGSCLMLAVRRLGPDGKPLFCGLAHFSDVSIRSFLQQEEGNGIQRCLDEAARLAPAFDLFVAGMHDTERFDQVCDLIAASYSLSKFETNANPWNVNIQDRLHDDEFVRYLEEKKYCLKAGMTENGELFIADQACGPISDDFIQFSEQDFEQWKNKRILKNSLKGFGPPSFLNPRIPDSNAGSLVSLVRGSAKRKLFEAPAEAIIHPASRLIKKSKIESEESEAKKNSPITVIIDQETFDGMFDAEKVIDVEMDTFVSGENVTPLMTSGVATCLGLVIRSFDPQGNLVYSGVGHFSSVEILLEADEDPDDKNPLKELLDMAKESIGKIPGASFEIVAAGMHDKQDFEGLELMISALYNPTRFETFLINPWNMPANAIERPDNELLSKYIEDWGGSLRLGINEEGEVYVADERVVPSDAPGFLQFSEEEFETWKANQPNE